MTDKDKNASQKLAEALIDAEALKYVHDRMEALTEKHGEDYRAAGMIMAVLIAYCSRLRENGAPEDVTEEIFTNLSMALCQLARGTLTPEQVADAAGKFMETQKGFSMFMDD